MSLFEILFFNTRLILNILLVSFDRFLNYFKYSVQWRNRVLWKDKDNLIVRLINKFSVLVLEMRNLLMSDLWWWPHIKFDDSATKHEGKVAVLTGADQELGLFTAEALYKYGVKLILGVEDINGKSLELIKKSKRENSVNSLVLLELDTSSLKSVRKFAEEVIKLEPKIDILINCSEKLIAKKELTEEGLEKQFVANYLGHFLLTNLLLDNLKKSTNGRIVNVSDMLHTIGNIDFNDLNSEKEYNIYKSFARSKLAQVLVNKELAERLKDTSVTTYALSTNTLRYFKRFESNDWRQIFNDWLTKLSDPMNGIHTILYVSLSEQLKTESGFYYNNCQRIDLVSKTTDETSKLLWKISCELTGIENKEDLIVEPIQQTQIGYYLLK